MNSISWITPDWPAPANVRSATTLRAGGASVGAFASLNLATHVGDDPVAVTANRRLLRAALDLPGEPVWLNQVHGTRVADAHDYASPPTADASVAIASPQICAILTADCLPVLFCDRRGTRVGAAHAGWRGLASGVLDATVATLDCEPDELLAWLGPAIEPEAFEVGSEVREQFLARDPAHSPSFIANPRGRWQADLCALARRALASLGVTQVFGGGYRCFADRERFFSYRRDGQTGRMATIVWLAS